MLAEMKETEVDIEAVAEKALADSELLSGMFTGRFMPYRKTNLPLRNDRVCSLTAKLG